MVAEQIKPLDAKTIGASTYAGRKPQTLLQAAKHNLRAIQKELGANGHIDATRICLNEITAGPDTPAGVAALALSLMVVAGVDVSKLRKDHTQAHELLFTLSADTTVNTKDYFGRCLAWVGDQFGYDNIVSAVVHLDEAAPHLHVLVVPIQAGRYVGTSLIDRARLKKLRALFAAEVAPTFGLKVMEPLTGARRSRAIEVIYERLKTTQDAILQSVLWETVKADIARQPARYMARLGITHVPVNDGGAEFRRIALSTGKGGKTERRAKPYGFEGGAPDDVAKPYGFETDLEKHGNPSCVGFPSPSPPAPPTTAPQPAPATSPTDQFIDDVDQLTEIDKSAMAGVCPNLDTPESQGQREEVASGGQLVDAPFIETITRHHDCDQSPDRYDLASGDYIPTQPSAPRRHQQAVNAALSGLATSNKFNRRAMPTIFSKATTP